MAAIGRRDGQSTLSAMPVIVFNYGWPSNLAFDYTAVNGCSARGTLPKSAKRRCNHKVLIAVRYRPIQCECPAERRHFPLCLEYGSWPGCLVLLPDDY